MRVRDEPDCGVDPACRPPQRTAALPLSEAVRRRILDPEPENALGRACDYGLDLTLILRAVERTPDERLDKAVQARALARVIRELKRGLAAADVRDLLRHLAEARVRFVIVGGVDLQLQGSAYTTFDIDVAYERSRENCTRLASALEPFTPRPRGWAVDLVAELDGLASARGNSVAARDLDKSYRRYGERS